MSKIISEENPAAQPAGQQPSGADQKIRKQARQLAYDVRYKVKQGFKDGQKADPVSLKRAFISQLGKSPAPGPVKAVAKKMLVGESYDFVDVTDTVKSSVSDVLNSVFTIGGKKEEEVVEDVGLKKFKVRVKDKKTGRSYVRMADRAKISELRKNPNIASVEMTSGGGTAYEGEKKKGAATASVKAGKGVPGDIEKVKEEFIGEVNTEDDNPSANPKKIDVMKGKNKVVINPTQSEQVDAQAKKDDQDDKPAEPPKMDPKEKRVSMMKRMILQKKMQAVRSGAGADIVAHTEHEGDTIEESEKVAQGAQKRATELGAKRRQASYKKYGANVGSPGKNERAGYNLARAARSSDSSLETQSTKKKSPAGADTSQIGHSRKAYEKTDTGKSGKKLKTPKYKLSFKDRQQHHSNYATTRRDPKQNPKHTANTKKEQFDPNEATMENTNEAFTVTAADKKGNTPAWQGYKAGKKNVKTGKPLYKAADHVKEGTNRLGLKSWTNFVEDNDIDRPIKDQTDKQIADVTFDGGAAIPATIKGSGDAREIPTAIALIKNKYRAQGIMASKEPEGELVDEGLIGKAIQGVGKAVQGAGKAVGGAENVATGTVKGVVKGTTGAAKKVVKTVGGAVSGGTKSATQKEMTDYQKLESAKQVIRDILTQESVGSAVDKGLSAGADVAKVAGKVAKGGVKVASKVAKGAADTAATVAGTPIGVAKSIKKGWQKGTQAESVGSAIDKGLSAGADVAKVAGKVAKGSVKVASKVAKGAADTAAHVVGTPIGVAKSIKKGFQKGSSAE